MALPLPKRTSLNLSTAGSYPVHASPQTARTAPSALDSDDVLLNPASARQRREKYFKVAEPPQLSSPQSFYSKPMQPKTLRLGQLDNPTFTAEVARALADPDTVRRMLANKPAYASPVTEPVYAPVPPVEVRSELTRRFTNRRVVQSEPTSAVGISGTNVYGDVPPRKASGKPPSPKQATYRKESYGYPEAGPTSSDYYAPATDYSPAPASSGFPSSARAPSPFVGFPKRGGSDRRIQEPRSRGELSEGKHDSYEYPSPGYAAPSSPVPYPAVARQFDDAASRSRNDQYPENGVYVESKEQYAERPIIVQPPAPAPAPAPAPSAAPYPPAVRQYEDAAPRPRPDEYRESGVYGDSIESRPAVQAVSSAPPVSTNSGPSAAPYPAAGPREYEDYPSRPKPDEYRGNGADSYAERPAVQAVSIAPPVSTNSGPSAAPYPRAPSRHHEDAASRSRNDQYPENGVYVEAKEQYAERRVVQPPAPAPAPQAAPYPPVATRQYEDVVSRPRPDQYRESGVYVESKDQYTERPVVQPPAPAPAPQAAPYPPAAVRQYEDAVPRPRPDQYRESGVYVESTGQYAERPVVQPPAPAPAPAPSAAPYPPPAARQFEHPPSQAWSSSPGRGSFTEPAAPAPAATTGQPMSASDMYEAFTRMMAAQGMVSSAVPFSTPAVVAQLPAAPQSQQRQAPAPVDPQLMQNSVNLAQLQLNLKNVGGRYRELIVTLREADLSQIDPDLVADLKLALRNATKILQTADAVSSEALPELSYIAELESIMMDATQAVGVFEEHLCTVARLLVFGEPQEEEVYEGESGGGGRLGKRFGSHATSVYTSAREYDDRREDRRRDDRGRERDEDDYRGDGRGREERRGEERRRGRRYDTGGTRMSGESRWRNRASSTEKGGGSSRKPRNRRSAPSPEAIVKHGRSP